MGARAGRRPCARFFDATTTGPTRSAATHASAHRVRPTSNAAPRARRLGSRVAVDCSPDGHRRRRVQIPSTKHRRCTLRLDRCNDRVRTGDPCPDRYLVAVEARAVNAAHRTVDDADVGLHPHHCGQRALLRISVTRTRPRRRADHHRNRGPTRVEPRHLVDHRSSPARLGRAHLDVDRRRHRLCRSDDRAAGGTLHVALGTQRHCRVDACRVCPGAVRSVARRRSPNASVAPMGVRQPAGLPSGLPAAHPYSGLDRWDRRGAGRHGVAVVGAPGTPRARARQPRRRRGLRSGVRWADTRVPDTRGNGRSTRDVQSPHRNLVARMGVIPASDRSSVSASIRQRACSSTRRDWEELTTR